MLFSSISNPIRGDLFEDPQNFDPRQSLLSLFRKTSKKGANWRQERAKEGFEGTRPKEGVKMRLRGTPQRGCSLTTLVETSKFKLHYLENGTSILRMD